MKLLSLSAFVTAPSFATTTCPHGALRTESGEVRCLPQLSFKPKRHNLTSSSTNLDLENYVFRSYCQSPWLLQDVINQCSEDSRGFDNCGFITLKDTYFTTAGGDYTYYFDGNLEYLYDQVNYDTLDNVVDFHEWYNNGAHKSPPVTLKDSKGFSTTVSFSQEEDFQVSAGVEMKFKVGLPLIAETDFALDLGFEWDLKTTNSHSETATQTIEVDQVLEMDPVACTNACVMGTRKQITLPYNINGRYVGRMVELGETWAVGAGAACCFVRPGGSDDCGILGRDPSKAGWTVTNTIKDMAAAVQNPDIGDCWDGSPDGCASLPGNMVGGLQMHYRVDVMPYPLNECPHDDDSCFDTPSPSPSPSPSPPYIPAKQIVALNDWSKCFDLPGGDTSNGNRVWIWECNGGESQMWSFGDDWTLRYGRDQWKCLDGGTMDPGASLSIWDCNGYPQQNFGYDGDSGAIYLSSSSSARDASVCVDMPGGSANDGTQLWVWGCNGYSSQQFGVGFGGYTIQYAADTSMCLDLPGGSTDNSNALWVWECNGYDSQLWIFNGWALQSAADSSKCIDAGSMGDGTQLYIWDCNSYPQQLWAINDEVSTFYLQNAAVCMDLAGGYAYNGAAVQAWDCNGYENQQWIFAGQELARKAAV